MTGASLGLLSFNAGCSLSSGAGMMAVLCGQWPWSSLGKLGEVCVTLKAGFMVTLMGSLVTCCCDTVPDLNVRGERFLLARGFKRDSPSWKVW